MSAVPKPHSISEPEYLAGELRSHVKHEFLAGQVYAMAGASNLHNDVAGNIFAALKVRLRGRPCRPYNSDTKVRLNYEGERFFYYPDASVTCRPNSPEESFQDAPAAIFEVLSESTRRIDEREKKSAYLAQESLYIYALVEVQIPKVIVWRRAGSGFVREVIEGLAASISLPELETELPLAEIFEDITFAVSD